MLNLLWLVPVLPLLGFLLLATLGGRMNKTAAAIIGAGSVGISAILTILIGISFISSPPSKNFLIRLYGHG